MWRPRRRLLAQPIEQVPRHPLDSRVQRRDHPGHDRSPIGSSAHDHWNVPPRTPSRRTRPCRSSRCASDRRAAAGSGSAGAASAWSFGIDRAPGEDRRAGRGQRREERVVLLADEVRRSGRRRGARFPSYSQCPALATTQSATRATTWPYIWPISVASGSSTGGSRQRQVVSAGCGRRDRILRPRLPAHHPPRRRRRARPRTGPATPSSSADRNATLVPGGDRGLERRPHRPRPVLVMPDEEDQPASARRGPAAARGRRRRSSRRRAPPAPASG